MKQLVVILVLLYLAGCAGQSVKDDYYTKINFNIKAGYYESLLIDSWEIKKPVCANISLISPRYETKWLPKLGISILDSEDLYTAEVFLVAKTRKSEDVVLMYSLHEKEAGFIARKIISDDISYKDKVDVNIVFTDSGGITILSNRERQTHSIPFEPSRLRILSSSGVAEVGLIDEDECNKLVENRMAN